MSKRNIFNIFKEPRKMNPAMQKSSKTTDEVAQSEQHEGSRLSSDQPAHTTQSDVFEAVITRATEVFANRQKALRWLGTPVRALEYATPISLLDRPDGRSSILNVLDKIEHGVL